MAVPFSSPKTFFSTVVLPRASWAFDLSDSWRLLRQLGRKVLNILMVFLLLIGGATVWDEVVGDGALPRLNTFKDQIPTLVAQARQNSTQDLSLHASPATRWEALHTTRQILRALSPELTLWLYTLHREHQIEYREPDQIHAAYGLSSDTPLLAAYQHSSGKLYLGQAFWRLNDGEKIAVLSHEYRHYRQNPCKRFSRQLAQLVGMGHLQSQSLLEAEALAYEKETLAALGL